MVDVEWRVYDDASRSVSLGCGVFPAQWIRAGDTHSSSGPVGVRVSTLHPQLVAEIAQEASKLLEVDGGDGTREVSFPMNASVFGLQAAGDISGSAEMYCVLKTQAAPSQQREQTESTGSSWLDLKLQRAAFHRQRGNDRFKRDAVGGAIGAYEKALQWLACPSEHCDFSAEERERVNAIAIPCHANLATCHWKRHNMDACIKHATLALALDPSHAKARFRRSQAYLKTKQFDEAVADLDQVVSADSESKLFSASLETAKLARQQHRNKQKHALAAAFQG